MYDTTSMLIESPIYNTTFSEKIYKYLDLKYHTANTHVKFHLITLISSLLCIGVYLRQLTCMPSFPDTCICLDQIRSRIFFIIIEVREIIPYMFKDMMTI